MYSMEEIISKFREQIESTTVQHKTEVDSLKVEAKAKYDQLQAENQELVLQNAKHCETVKELQMAVKEQECQNSILMKMLDSVKDEKREQNDAFGKAESIMK